MRDLELDDSFGHFVDRLPGPTLATDNLVSMFGLNRRLRGALIGHLVLFEMCSVVPMGRDLAAARRIGGLPTLERFFEVHVEADAHHARLASSWTTSPNWPPRSSDALLHLAGGALEPSPSGTDGVPEPPVPRLSLRA